MKTSAIPDNLLGRGGRAATELAEANRVKLEAPRLLKATSDFVAIYDGQTALIEKGSIVVEGAERG